MAKKFSDFVASQPAESQERIKARTAALLRTIPLAELRRAREFSQEMLGDAMGASQSSISKLERRTDLYVSSLREYIEALGGVLEIRACFPNGEITVTNFGADTTRIVRVAPKRRSKKTTAKKRRAS